MSMQMLKNYVKVALSNLRRRRLYSLVNGTGMVVALVCIALIFLFVRGEYAYDSWIEGSENVYRLETLPDEVEKANALVIRDVGIELASSAAEVETVAEFAPQRSMFVRPGDGARGYIEDNVYVTDAGSDFFQIFSLAFVEGDAASALAQPGKVVLTRSTAERYFGDGSALGQRVRIDSVDTTVSGVVEDTPIRSHFDLDMIYSVNQALTANETWGFSSYVRLRPDADPAEVSARLESVVERVDARYLNQTFGLRPVRSIHLESDARHDYKQGGDTRYIYGFIIIGLLVLLVSYTNYTNLTMAMSAKRSTEVGVRRALGASRGQVALQFLGESVVLVALCLPIALAIVALVLPAFAATMGSPITHADLLDPAFVLGILGLVLLIGVVVGLRPALSLASESMTSLFANDRWTGGGSSAFGLRQTLVVIQFALLIAFASATYVVNRQIEFISDKDIGIETEGLIYLNNGGALSELGMTRFGGMRNRLLELPEVEVVSAMLTPPGNENMPLTGFGPIGADTSAFEILVLYGDKYIFDALGVEGLTPSYFDQPVEERPNGILASVSALERVGSGPDLGGTATLVSDPGTEWTQEVEPIGAFGDFNFFSLYREEVPIVISSNSDYDFFGTAVIRARTSDYGSLISEIEDIWYQYIPNDAFVYGIVEDDYSESYVQETTFARIGAYLSVVAIIIAVVGLIALTSLITQLRSREIAVRRSFGATTLDIIRLLNKETVWLVALSVLIATPITYLAVQEWLSGFAYRIEVGAAVFLLAGLAGFFIAAATATAQAFRVARLDPTEVLRSE